MDSIVCGSELKEVYQQLSDEPPWNLVQTFKVSKQYSLMTSFTLQQFQVKILIIPSLWFMIKYLQNEWHSHQPPRVSFVLGAQRRMLKC